MVISGKSNENTYPQIGELIEATDDCMFARSLAGRGVFVPRANQPTS